MKGKPYIIVSDENDREPKESELVLDFADDMEYTTPYQTYGEDNFNFGSDIAEEGIFDSR